MSTHYNFTAGPAPAPKGDTKAERQELRIKLISDALDAVMESVKQKVIKSSKCMILGYELKPLNSQMDHKTQQNIPSALLDRLYKCEYDVDVYFQCSNCGTKHENCPFNWLITDMAGSKPQMKHVFGVPFPELPRGGRPVFVHIPACFK